MNKQVELLGISQPKRVKHAYTQTINGTPAQGFPLLCPVREVDWAPGWSTDWVVSKSGTAEQECMFQTPALGDKGTASTWIITRYEPDSFEVEMYKVTPGHTVGKLVISLVPEGSNHSQAHISYEYTSLGQSGDEFLAKFTAESYGEFMQNWEKAMNHYLETGELWIPG